MMFFAKCGQKCGQIRKDGVVDRRSVNKSLIDIEFCLFILRSVRSEKARKHAVFRNIGRLCLVMSDYVMMYLSVVRMWSEMWSKMRSETIVKI